ncbi:dehydrogenase/reductase SDR family member 1 [Lepeophtheirus salmonis]|uniref:Dehydrogenase/reductase (SDR family) member 1 [Latimeria chalumnae] n=1 Tax=Lepeophtheirus salmonis TaxID=72036 RepID=A0A0K2T9U1_LEPSM|nr:dehydrogenase/reductase SDR family member 1-like [Lepeophtheirus salmonis]
MSLAGKVCIVTGASRGIGKGIAVQLGGSGATVYITGRSNTDLKLTANEIKSRGGNPIVVQMDHSRDEDIERLFNRVRNEQNGKLDLLVNNAYSGVKSIMENHGKKFWEVSPLEVWDSINGVGLRNHYICTSYAAKIMQLNRSGLIINVSSAGGVKYIFNVAYGVGKEGCDRMAADCAIELQSNNIAMISLWPGPVKTEEISKYVLDNPDAPAESKKVFENGESTEFSGKAVVQLLLDSAIMKKTGRILLTADLAREYGFKDIDGTITGDMFSLKNVLNMYGFSLLASFVPSFLRAPKIFLHFISYKF